MIVWRRSTMFWVLVELLSIVSLIKSDINLERKISIEYWVLLLVSVFVVSWKNSDYLFKTYCRQCTIKNLVYFTEEKKLLVYVHTMATDKIIVFNILIIIHRTNIQYHNDVTCGTFLLSSSIFFFIFYN